MPILDAVDILRLEAERDNLAAELADARAEIKNLYHEIACLEREVDRAYRAGGDGYN